MPRNTISRRGIVLVVSSITAVVALAACTPPLPPDVLAAKAENQITCQTGDQTVAVADDFMGAMLTVNGVLQGVCPDQTVTEVAAAESAKLRIIGQAPTEEDLASFKKDCPVAPIVVPAFGYAVDLSYNIIGLEGLILDAKTIAGILQGSITSWEDPAIAALNDGVDLTNLPPIAVASVQTPSPAVAAMQAWLVKEGVWSAPVDGLLAGSTTYPTAADLASELMATEGTVAVVPVATAVANAVPVASIPVQDVVVSPDDGQLLKVGIAATAVTKDAAGNITATPAVGGVPVEGNFNAAAAKVVLAEDQPLIGWPIVGMAHLMVCDDGTDPLPLSTSQYLLRLAGQGALETFGLTPLPEPIRVQTFAPLKVTVDPNASLPPASPTTAASGQASPTAS